MNLKTILILITSFALPLSLFSQEEDIIIGRLIKFKSKILNEERNILVHVPNTYGIYPNRKYPVVFLLDGYHQFDHVSTNVEYLSNRFPLVPEMIVVGIGDEGPAEEQRDCLAERTEAYPDGGGADNFLNFLKTELIPHIDATYRTTNYRILIGHGFGGNFAVYTLMEDTDLFKAYLSISGKFYPNTFNLLNRFTDFMSLSQNITPFVYAAVGSSEKKEIVEGNQQFRSIITRYAPESMNWHYEVLDEGHNHLSVTPEGIYKGLRILFKDYSLNRQFMFNATIEEIALRINTQIKSLGTNQPYNEFILPEYAGHFINDPDKWEITAEILKINEACYPQSTLTLTMLAKVYTDSKQYQKSLDYYKKLEKLLPKDQAIKQTIYQLELEILRQKN